MHLHFNAFASALICSRSLTFLLFNECVKSCIFISSVPVFGELSLQAATSIGKLGGFEVPLSGDWMLFSAAAWLPDEG